MTIKDEGGKVVRYEGGVTVMELICASVCYTSMICFSMEYRFGTMHNTEVNMHRHRVGARGNVTCFPLPWEQLLEQFQELGRSRAQVPRTGEELGDLVRILLKSSSRNANVAQELHTPSTRSQSSGGQAHHGCEGSWTPSICGIGCGQR